MEIVLITGDEIFDASLNLDCSPGDCSPVNACNPDYEITKVEVVSPNN